MYFYPLNVIRFLLAVGVVLFHYGLEFYPFNLPVIKTGIEHSGFRVSFFFFISGFVMSLVYAPKYLELTPRQFYHKRFTRIFPVYWLALLFTLLLVLFLKGSTPKGLSIMLNLFALQSCNPGYVLDLNYPTWSISVELFFYVSFPFLLKWLMKKNIATMLWITLMVWAIQTLQHVLFVELFPAPGKKMEEFTNAFPIWHFSTFLFGITTARFVLNESVPRFFIKGATFYLLFCLLIFLSLMYIPNPLLKYIHNGLLSPLFALTVVALYYDRSFIHRVLSHPRLVVLGNLSFGLFIFQYPLWLVCKAFSSEDFSRTSFFFFIYFVSLLSFSALVYRFFEKPMLQRLRTK